MYKYSVSKRLNEFIESLKDENNPYAVEIFKIGKETVIIYEDYEHEPIKNYNSTFKKYKTRKRQKGFKHSEETKKKISESKKGIPITELHKLKIKAGKAK